MILIAVHFILTSNVWLVFILFIYFFYFTFLLHFYFVFDICKSYTRVHFEHLLFLISLILILIGHAMDDNRITRAISLCKKVVSSFSYSWKKRRELAEVQIQLGLPAHQLITESATRWGSWQQMIERFLEQEAAITKVLSADKKSRHLVSTWQDIEVLESIQKALKPLQDFTDALSGEEYVTISYVRPVLHLFNKSPVT